VGAFAVTAGTFEFRLLDMLDMSDTATDLQPTSRFGFVTSIAQGGIDMGVGRIGFGSLELFSKKQPSVLGKLQIVTLHTRHILVGSKRLQPSISDLHMTGTKAKP
jgi:hypothetical protein